MATPPAFAAELPSAGPDTPLVGRDDELAYLEHVLHRARAERNAHLFTLLGAAGIGKTRLARELAARAEPEVTVLVGRCLGSGVGMTYWPLREIVRQAAGSETAVAARTLLDDEEDDPERVASRIALALGTSEGRGGGEETAWAFRRLFEALARRRPLVLTIEDVHRADPALLDLLEYVADRADDAPLLLLCLARPELLTRRRDWAGGLLNAASLRLGSLPPVAAEHLLAGLSCGQVLPEDVREQIADVADGNPLFLEQVLAMLTGPSGGEQQSVPSTIEALLATRLDLLTPDEALVAEAASAVGSEFPVAVLGALVARPLEPAALAGVLASLSRQALVARVRDTAPGDERFRFRNTLIHDAVYRRVPGERRALLHERLADVIEAAARPGTDELLAYHLERAARLRLEFAPDDAGTATLAGRAVERLTAAGRRAADRGDESACTSLLERALGLLPEGAAERPRLLLEVAEAHSWAGDYQLATSAYQRASAAARAAGDETLELAARACGLEAEVSVGHGATAVEAYELAERAVTRLEERGDLALLSRAWAQLAGAASWLGQHAEAELAARRSLTLAEAAGDDRARAHAVVRLSIALVEGPAPSADALEEIAAHTAWSRRLGYRSVEFWLLGYEWELQLFSGNVEQAARRVSLRRSLVEELGMEVYEPRLDWTEGCTALETDHPLEAETRLRAALEGFERAGEGATAGSVAATLAEHLARTGSRNEADTLSRLAEDRADASFVEDQVRWRCARATVLAAQDRLEEAESLAREATALADETDSPTLRAQTRLVGLAPVLARAAPDEAAAVLEEAATICERKGLLLWAEKARAMAERLA